ncbi:hypothetical protein [Pararhizobium sp. O133]|uniref:hypothetical protein n=1 Tax=Pararhizobium sp. O133 TaxID=3449278 RepID=UPI003F684953
MNVHAKFQPNPNGKPLEIHHISVVVPQQEREVHIDDVSLDASTLWHLLDNLENRMGDEDGQEESALLVRLAVQLARQLDLDLRAFSGALPPSN